MIQEYYSNIEKDLIINKDSKIDIDIKIEEQKNDMNSKINDINYRLNDIYSKIDELYYKFGELEAKVNESLKHIQQPKINNNIQRNINSVKGKK